MWWIYWIYCHTLIDFRLCSGLSTATSVYFGAESSKLVSLRQWGSSVKGILMGTGEPWEWQRARYSSGGEVKDWGQGERWWRRVGEPWEWRRARYSSGGEVKDWGQGKRWWRKNCEVRGGVKQGGEGCQLCFRVKSVKSSMLISTNSTSCL